MYYHIVCYTLTLSQTTNFRRFQTERVSLFPHSVFKRFVLQRRKILDWERVNSLPNDKILNSTKLKAFADDKITLPQVMMFFPLIGFENIVGKGENAGYQHFLLFPQCLQAAYY